MKLNLNMLSVSFLFLFSFTYSQSMNRALVGIWHLTTRVKVTLSSERGHLFVYIVKKWHLNRNWHICLPLQPFITWQKWSACPNNAFGFSFDWFVCPSVALSAFVWSLYELFFFFVRSLNVNISVLFLSSERGHLFVYIVENDT